MEPTLLTLNPVVQPKLLNQLGDRARYCPYHARTPLYHGGYYPYHAR